MNNGDIAFIGGGNMARSLIGGLVARGHAPGAAEVLSAAALEAARPRPSGHRPG